MPRVVPPDPHPAPTRLTTQHVHPEGETCTRALHASVVAPEPRRLRPVFGDPRARRLPRGLSRRTCARPSHAARRARRDDGAAPRRGRGRCRRHGAELPQAGRGGRRRPAAPAPTRASASATASASGSRPAPPSSTSRSSPCWPRAPRTCPSTPTTRTSGPSSSSARPGCARSSATAGRSPSTTRRSAAPGAPGAGDDAWIIFTSGSTGTPEGRRGQPPLPPRRSSTPRRACSSPTSRSARATGCWRGCRWRSTPPARRCGSRGGTAPAWCPAPRALVRTGVDLGPWLEAQRITIVSTVPDARRAVAAGRAGRRPAADLRRRGVPARAGRAAGRRGPRGVEHLRPHRGHRRRLRRAADRRGAGADRAAARRLGARRRRRRRASRSRWATAASW